MDLCRLTKSGHPHIRSDVDSHRIVGFRGFKIVIPYKHHLHPSLPFFGLFAVQNLVFSSPPGETGCDHNEHKNKKQEQVSRIHSVSRWKIVLVVAEIVQEHDESKSDKALKKTVEGWIFTGLFFWRRMLLGGGFVRIVAETFVL